MDNDHTHAEASRLETARSALKAAFGSDPVGAMAPVGGGASGAFPFRADVAGRTYLVRVEGDPSPLRNPHQYESMRIAAEAGLAPRLHHIDEAARVAVMDFIEEQPLATYPGGPVALTRAIGERLRVLQGTPSFPRFVEYPDMVCRLWAWVRRTGLFAPGVLDRHTDHLERIREAYAWDAAGAVSSHNDTVPRNILFDGRRLWLIDWESAYRNDPLVDVAITLDCFAPSPELEVALVGAWLDRSLDARLAVRLAQVRALTRLYYAGVFFSASAAASGPLADRDVSAPTIPEFRRAIQNGTITPGTPSAKHILGKMYLASFLTGDVPPGLDAA
jgi:aminoglycoside phosphotransferase (APT) family kinase protein